MSNISNELILHTVRHDFSFITKEHPYLLSIEDEYLFSKKFLLVWFSYLRKSYTWHERMIHKITHCYLTFSNVLNEVIHLHSILLKTHKKKEQPSF